MTTRDKVYEMLRDFDTTMLVTVGGEQDIHPGRVRRLWKEPYRVWFPEGPDDSDIATDENQHGSGKL